MASDDIHAMKGQVRLSDSVRTKVKLVRQGPDWSGCCPFHQEKTPSFTVNDAKGFYHCFGCGAHGDILDWWQKVEGLSFADARDRLRVEAGEAMPRLKPAPSMDQGAERNDDTRRKQEEARAIWRQTLPIAGTVAETYLRQARCIGLETLPSCLRFHPALLPDPRHPEACPALVVAVTDKGGVLVAIQRTFLKADGSGKAGFSAPKRSLGPIGLGAVKLGEAASIIGIAEGVETGLSAMELFQVPVWCALGNGLGRIDLPNVVRNVVIFADKGRAGEEAAMKARQIFRSQGRKVNVRFSEIGGDFNDELRARRNGS